MSGYIMHGERETERLVRKTEHVLVRRHLSWAGIQPGESFADFGCGTGEVVAEAARINHGAPVVGVDADAGRIAHGRHECRRHNLPNARFQAASITGPGSSGLPSDAFDHAWTRFFLEYQPQPTEVVREMARVVAPGGKITLIDVEGNCTRHFGMDRRLQAGLREVLADLARTGFDPDAGRNLVAHANAIGLVDVRHELEPYHRIVGAPDPHTAATWRLKLETIRDNYVERLFPQNANKRWVFDALLEFLLSEETMTWSFLHLVQATKPPTPATCP